MFHLSISASPPSPRLPQKCHHCVKGPDPFNHSPPPPKHSQTRPFRSGVLWYTHPSIHSFIHFFPLTVQADGWVGVGAIRNNNAQGSCDRQTADGLALELYVWVTGGTRTAEEEESCGLRGRQHCWGRHVQWHQPLHSPTLHRSQTHSSPPHCSKANRKQMFRKLSCKHISYITLKAP